MQLVDFALRHLEIGYVWQEHEDEARKLNKILFESGTAWRVRRIPNKWTWYLERRTDPATGPALVAATTDGGPAAGHLSEAWHAAYGQHPNPSEAYRLALKAIEDVAIPVVLPNDQSATLGKVIGALRANPNAWKCVFTQPVGPAAAQRDPVYVVTDMLGLLWQNHTDRHGTGQPPLPVTQRQAELAVNLALALVPIFRNGALIKR